MAKSPKHWRQVFRRVTRYNESATLSSSSYTWKRTLHHLLVLECGHRTERHGNAAPPTKVDCKDCAAGVAPVALGDLRGGVFDHTRKAPINDPIAQALLDKVTGETT